MQEKWIHSGGCEGADLEWEKQAQNYGYNTVAYSFNKHYCNTIYNTTVCYIMTPDELLEGWGMVTKANNSLNRNIKAIEYNPYVRNLMCRNWFQVKHSEAIFAIGFLQGKDKVEGGTGWGSLNGY